jgi:hypothetical protein
MSKLRGQDGFTVMEVLMAITVGFVVLATTLGLLESSVRLNTGVMAKTDAMQRGRLAMDIVTQQLRSQVCLDYTNSAVIAGSDENNVKFYADFTEAGTTPVKRLLTFDKTTGKISAFEYRVPAGTPTPPPVSAYPSTPTRSNLVLDAIAPQYDDVAKKDVPFLRYYAYQETGGVLRADQELLPPLDAAEAARVARIEVSFFARPTRSKDDTKGVNLSDQVMARHADPNLTVPDPNCV